MPFRTFRDMFPEQLDNVGIPFAHCLQPTESILTAYTGTGIACSGTVDINCSYDGREWRNTKLFVVDVPGAAILRLSTFEALHVVTLDCELSNKPQKINNIRDLMQQYPQQFDRIGELQKTQDMFPEQLDNVGIPFAHCLQPTESILTAYTGTGIACSGTVDINCSYDGREWRNTKLFVVDVPGAAILRLSTCEALHVVTLDCELSNKPQKINNIRDLMQQYPQQFDRIGELQKTHNLVVHPKVTTRIDPPRRTLIALKDNIESELDKMVDQRIIHTIEEPVH